MNKKTQKILFVFLLSIGLISTSLAQRQTGSLKGVVVDEDSQPLPGVNVTLSGPVLVGKMNFLTSETGNYRFPALPPGKNFTITCALSGFTTVTQGGIIINVGKTTTINITLTQAPIHEEITVTAPSPVVDTTASKSSINISRELLDNLPADRDVYKAINTSAGMADYYPELIFAYGSPYMHTTHSVDGVIASDVSSTTADPLSGTHPDIVEEIEVEFMAHPAEVGGTAGAYINIVTASGGSEFHAGANVYYFDESFVGQNLTDEQLDALGVSIPGTDKVTQDFSVNFGGPIIKDKLHFFITGRYLYKSRTVLDFPLDDDTKDKSGFIKLTFAPSKNIKLVGSYSIHTYLRENDGGGKGYTTDATYMYEPQIWWFNAQLSWILSQNAFLDFRVMKFRRYMPFKFHEGATIRNYDRGTGVTSGRGYRQEYYNRERPLILNQSLTLFKDDFLGGSHEFKMGTEFEWSREGSEAYFNIPIDTYTWNGSPYYYGGNQGQFRAQAWSTEKGQGERVASTFRFSFYVQDSITIERLTLNLGMRFDSMHGGLPAQSAAEVPYWLWLDPDYFSKKDYPERKNLISFNVISPRIGLTFDVFGTGKTVAKASYGRYYNYLYNRYFSGTNPNQLGYIDYRWTDENLDGEIGPEDTFVETYRRGRYDTNPTELFDPDYHFSPTDEFVVGVEHELSHNFKVGASFIYKTQDNISVSTERNLEQNWGDTFTITDPGYDGINGTGDEQQLTIYDRIGPAADPYYTNLEVAWRKYRGVTVIFEKRMSNKWQFSASVTYSKTWGTQGLDRPDYLGWSPNAMINREGRLFEDFPLILKLQATYQFPYGINLTGYFVQTSGEPWQRMLSVYTPHAGYVTILAEPYGSRRQPDWNRLDLRLEKKFTFGDFGKLGVFVDVYNALNVAFPTVDYGIWTGGQGYIESDGSFTPNPIWGTTYDINMPRIYKLGLRFTF